MEYGNSYIQTEPLPFLLAVINQDIDTQNLKGVVKINLPHWIIDYSLSDCGYDWTDTVARQVRPGGICHVYPPNTTFYEDCSSIRRLRSIYVFHAGSTPALRKLATNSKGFARIIDEERVLQNLLLQCGDTASRYGDEGYLYVYQKFCDVLAYFQNVTLFKDDYIFKQAESRQPDIAGQIRLYLENHYASKITIADLAQYCHVSKSTLTHRYHALSNESIFETLLKIRLERSIPLLALNKPLKHIAVQVGFRDEFYYSKIFKRYYGVSPKRYLKF